MKCPRKPPGDGVAGANFWNGQALAGSVRVTIITVMARK